MLVRAYFYEYLHSISHLHEEVKVIVPMSYFQKSPYTYGDTTMEDFFEDQHLRRRFLQKYSVKLFPKIKKCKNEMCSNYHDNKNSYCSNECRDVWEQELILRRYGDGHQDMSHLRCDNCRYYVPHRKRFKCFKGRCVEETVTNNREGEFLVNPDHWCHFFIQQETKRNRQ